MQQKRVNVTHDWGTLKEVVVGRVIDFRYPEYSEKLRQSVAYVPEKMQKQLRDYAGKLFSETSPGDYERAVAQVENLVEFLEKRNIVIHRPRALSDEELRAYYEFSSFSGQTYARDSMIVIGNHVIEAALRQPWRFKERFGLRPLFEQLAAERDCHYAVMPPPSPMRQEDIQSGTGAYLEGGDVFPFGKDVLVGHSQGNFATSMKGIEWLRNYLGDEYTVHTVALGADYLHLDDGLATVREGLAIICPDMFVEGLPDLIKGWEFINVTKYEALNLLAGNGMILGPNEILIDKRLPHIAEQLDKKGVNVHTIEYDAITIFAGGLRCSHHPLVRELD
ncbi:TPA: amidinotransferase [Methanosarcina acetivorans]|uniref:Amidinotransferase n=2 Tax=Methanosarcina acetivorans TaxID=2214 RepID=Q8TJX5_METAC|nr:dimethylarginine dimethylaminohydrolase family protein [Methanosarcina acetivorans]AAM07007.1 amidinotransferase [Methanosarcina acetivorans C2A]HIH93802.1 amidinotransferase [Methanosarcina acetivorans]